eukprot:gene7752-8594_t
MPSMNFSEITHLLNLWDNGSKSSRAEILKSFVNECKSKTAPELESHFSRAASLFLTRLTAWLRHKYLAEFLEVGGILTLLEILGLKQVKEEDKAECLKLLSCIAANGRKYKELICESFGVRAVAECLAKSTTIDTQDHAKYLLQDLATGNPRYEVQVYKALTSLLSSVSPKAQQLACHTLRYVQGIVGKASLSIVDPTLSLLRSLHVEVQYEAYELIKDLVKYDIQKDILQRLLSHLKPSKIDLEKSKDSLNEHSEELDAQLPVFVQQAAVAKCIGMLAKQNGDIAELLIELGVINGLLYAMGNDKHADSQRQASIALQYFVTNFPHVDDAVKMALGNAFYDEYMASPEVMYLKMTQIQINVLLNNRVDFSHAIPSTIYFGNSTGAFKGQRSLMV